STAKPEIAIEGCPKSGADIITEVPFEGDDGRLLLVGHSGIKLILREERWVGSEEPGSSIPIDDPMAPAPGKSNFRFERPAIVAPINQFPRIVLSRRRDHAETRTNNRLLRPTRVLSHCHCRSAFKVYGKSVHRIQQTRSVNICFSAQH